MRDATLLTSCRFCVFVVRDFHTIMRAFMRALRIHFVSGIILHVCHVLAQFIPMVSLWVGSYFPQFTDAEIKVRGNAQNHSVEQSLTLNKLRLQSPCPSLY